jgi:hypothetical protein
MIGQIAAGFCGDELAEATRQPEAEEVEPASLGQSRTADAEPEPIGDGIDQTTGVGEQALVVASADGASQEPVAVDGDGENSPPLGDPIGSALGIGTS